MRAKAAGVVICMHVVHIDPIDDVVKYERTWIHKE